MTYRRSLMKGPYHRSVMKGPDEKPSIYSDLSFTIDNRSLRGTSKNDLPYIYTIDETSS